MDFEVKTNHFSHSFLKILLTIADGIYYKLKI
nr:MAG TPA: hypothetical protein [Caudoviricetes sp.]